MKNEFVNYDQAVVLKELGFNKPCFGYYYTINGRDWKFAEKIEYLRLDDEINIGPNFNILAPLKQQAFRWFRDNYPELDFGFGKIHNETNNYHFHINLEWQFFEGTYEEADNACIDKLIEIVKQNNKK